MDLVEAIYLTTERFPNHERYGLAGQIQRAAVSVPSNIVEGHSRQHLNEYLQHLSIAIGSLAEVETQLEIAYRLKYVPQEESSKTHEQIVDLRRQLRSLKNSLTKRKP